MKGWGERVEGDLRSEFEYFGRQEARNVHALRRTGFREWPSGVERKTFSSGSGGNGALVGL